MTVTNFLLPFFSFLFTFFLLPNTSSSFCLNQWCQSTPFPNTCSLFVNIHYKTRGSLTFVAAKFGLSKGIETNNDNGLPDTNNLLEFKNVRPNSPSGLHKRALKFMVIKPRQRRAQDISFRVAKDGSAKFGTITSALNAATITRRKIQHQMIYIYIKEGTYQEYLDIKVANISLVGDGIGKTIITGDRIIAADGTGGVDSTATVTVTGKKGSLFVAQGITFRNTAGLPHKIYNQEVALRSDKGNSAFYKCSFEGYQDTLLADSGNQFYKECSISGSVDFIFGNALAVFQRCDISVRPSKNENSIVTAQSRKNPQENTGFVFQNCNIHPSDELKPFVKSNSKVIYLGRPWRMFARTIILNSQLEGINEKGWLIWNASQSTDNVEYGEYGNTGVAASTDGRVKWKNVHVLKSADEARKYTLGGGFSPQFNWLNKTNVPFDLDL